ncbi:hypothetical protein JCM15765_14720 [Paradesulfitobacterium aromaticivorans]
MPRTSIPVQTVPFQGGAAITYAAADTVNGNVFTNDSDTVLIVKNAGAGAITVTVTAVPDEAGRSVNLVHTVNATSDAVIGPLRTGWWNQRGADLGKVYIDFSGAASVAALKIQR